jgi:hypothetical protein
VFCNRLRLLERQKRLNAGIYFLVVAASNVSGIPSNAALHKGAYAVGFSRCKTL